MADPIKQTQPEWSDDSDPGVSFETAARNMKFLRVTPDELEDLKDVSSGSLELASVGITGGAFITMAVTLATVDLEGITKGVFITLTVVFLIFSLYFGAKSYKEFQKLRHAIDRLIKRASSQSRQRSIRDP